MDYSQTVLMKGRYQIVALTRGDDPDPALQDIVGYAVLTDSGARLCEVGSLDAARLYMDDLVERDHGAVVERPTRSKRHATGRPKVVRKVL